MKTSKLKRTFLITENDKLYLDLLYEIEDEHDIRELHIPRVEIPFDRDCYPDIKLGKDAIYCDNRPMVADVNYTLNTGYDNELTIRRGPDDKYYTIKTIKEKTQEMTLAEIEKKLGHKIKIISEDKKK